MTKLFTVLSISLVAIVSACQPAEQVEEIPSDYYTEKHRPQYHFSPEEMWMNDPNGMVYYDGEYHLFYQHYPDSTVWGPMHWGHAVSDDLVHWKHLPIALYPEKLGYIFSGSAVIDWENSSGLQGDSKHPPMVAIFTFSDPIGSQNERIDFQTQGLAYSLDRGRNWTMYEGNPVLPNPGIKDFRDPKVIWHQETNSWIMVLAAADRAHFYGSPDLINWTFLSEFGAEEGNHGGVWECPDLFPLAVNGTDEVHWVLIQSINPGAPNGGSGSQYFVGDFNGKTFTNSNAPDTELWMDYGRDNYAGVTWADVPATDGRRLFIGWMNNWAYAQVVPTEKWRSAMTLPRTLELVKTSEGLRIKTEPIAELQQLRGESIALDPQQIEGKVELEGELFAGSMYEGILTFDLANSESDRVGIVLSNSAGEFYQIGYDRTTKQFFSDRRQSGIQSFSDQFASQIHKSVELDIKQELRLHVFVDKSSIEMFTADGIVVFTETFFPTTEFNQFGVFAEQGAAELTGAEFYELGSAW